MAGELDKYEQSEQVKKSRTRYSESYFSSTEEMYLAKKKKCGIYGEAFLFSLRA